MPQYLRPWRDCSNSFAPIHAAREEIALPKAVFWLTRPAGEQIHTRINRLRASQQRFVGKSAHLARQLEMMRKNVESPLDATVDANLQEYKGVKYMSKTIMGAAVLAALALTGVTAHASCTDPRVAQLNPLQKVGPLILHQGLSPSWGRDADKIVGTWQVAYTADGATSPYAQAFIQWHGDRTEWENITMPVLGGNICMGSWKTVDEWHVFRNHVGWLFNNGIIAGYFNETETDEVAPDGNSYHGSNDTIGYDFSGNVVFEVKGTASATRIAP